MGVASRVEQLALQAMLTTPAPPKAPPAPAPRRETPSRESAERLRSLRTRRLSKVNLCTAVIVAGLGVVAVHGPMSVEEATTDGFTVGRIAPPAAALGRAADADGEAATAEPAMAAPAVAVKAMPTGKGMWIYEFPRTEGGNMDAIVAKAKETGITHVYPRMGSHWDGFNARQHLDAFLPKAHAAGLLVFGWDFPRLGDSLPSDIERARTMINYTAPSGDRLDGFSADIETINEGSHVSPAIASAYGKALREIAGPDFTLIATVPRPSPRHRPTYPYAEIVESFDAIAPMIYWLNRQPDTDVIGAMDELAKFGKPVFPVGQAYDGKAEGGRAGVPPPEELQRFMRTALDKGATGVSFWSWQAANGPAWAAIRDAFEFRGPEQAAV
ncbi:MAG TPA: hypothetical protein VF244_10400 [Acidimicrobiales bacterium]